MQKEATRAVQDEMGHTGQRDQQEIQDRKYDNCLKQVQRRTKENTSKVRLTIKFSNSEWVKWIRWWVQWNCRFELQTSGLAINKSRRIWQRNFQWIYLRHIAVDAWMQTNTVNFKHSKMCRSLLWKSWSCDYITLLDLLSMPILSNSYRREPWNCVCCLIPLQADLYTFPAQSYSNTLLMPITRGTLSNLWSLKPIATSSKTCSFYWQLRDGMLSTLIKMAWTLYIISNTHYTALLWFLSTKCVLFVVRMYYSSRIYCPFLFVLSMTSWFTLACYW